jgi:hypothetical protein
MTIKPISWDEYYSREPNEEEIEFCRTVRYSWNMDQLEKRNEGETR